MIKFNLLHALKYFVFWSSILICFVQGGLFLGGCNVTPSFSPTSQNIASTKANPNIHADLDALITDLEQSMPRSETEGFVIPSQSDQDIFKKAVSAIKGGTPDLLLSKLSEYNYEIIKLSDPMDSNAESYILREKTPITKGWGMYIFRVQPLQNIIVEAPHPLADKNTAEVSLDLYRTLHASVLLIAGAHRNANKDGSADSAHASETIFQAIHQTLFQIQGISSGQEVFIQVHGFAADGHPHYPQVVIGHNWQDDPEKDKLLNKIAAALRENHIKVGVCNGKNFTDLCGTENIQAAVTQGGIFIHIELNEAIRNDDTNLIIALKQAFNP
ncbi:MAG: hypothetical protein ABI986_02570 [Chloroflexota bacterium]